MGSWRVVRNDVSTWSYYGGAKEAYAGQFWAELLWVWLCRRNLQVRKNWCVSTVAYQATIPYLLEQNDPKSTWTLCTGASGDNGSRPAASMTQGALYSMANVACLDNADTNVRFNEVYLGFFVMAGAAADQFGVMKASEFAIVYEKILARPDIKGCRVMACQREDLTELRFKKKLE